MKPTSLSLGDTNSPHNVAKPWIGVSIPVNWAAPLTEHECKYLRYAVGTHISEDKMIRQDNELRFRPRVDDQNAAQVADVLDITDDVLIGAPKHLHPAPKTSPEILKTLQWIQNTLDNNDGNTIYQSADGKSAKHINLLTEMNGCHVTFVSETKEGL